MKINKPSITKGLLGKALTETISGTLTTKAIIVDVTFPNEGAVMLTLQGITVPLILKADTAIELAANGTVTYNNYRGDEIVLTIEDVKKKTKKTK